MYYPTLVLRPNRYFASLCDEYCMILLFGRVGMVKLELAQIEILLDIQKELNMARAGFDYADNWRTLGLNFSDEMVQNLEVTEMFQVLVGEKVLDYIKIFLAEIEQVKAGKPLSPRLIKARCRQLESFAVQLSFSPGSFCEIGL